MALFGKNANESAFVGGKKHWTDVLKNTSDGNLLIWRQPEEDFNTQSTLVVMPGEEAIFIKGGNVEQVFDSGTYKLSTENYPFISRLRNAFSGGVSTFNCVVYFVRKSHSMEILWGTASPLPIRDKFLGVTTPVRGRGSYKICVDNGVKLLNKMLGNNVNILTQNELDLYFSNEFQSIIRSTLSQALNDLPTELIEITNQLYDLGNRIQPLISPTLDDYGLKLVNFVIAALDIDDELRKRYDEARMGKSETILKAEAEAQKKLLEAQAEAQGKVLDYQAEKSGLDMLGGDWSRLQAANILETLAANPNSGGIAAAGAGIGMGMAAGSVFSGMAQQMFSPMQQPPQGMSPGPSSGGRFTQKSAAAPDSPAAPAPSAADEIIKLKGLLDAGILSQEEFDSAKKKLLGL
jgi:membrane protease subunit (stomatin/prohibitin family)